MRNVVRIAASVVVLSACDLSVDPPVQILWEATLIPAPEYAHITATAAAITYSNRTEASIGVQGAEDGTTFSWRIHNETCEQPGNVVGPATAYPDFTVEDNVGTTEAGIRTRLLPGNDYAALLLLAETAEIVACGQLRER